MRKFGSYPGSICADKSVCVVFPSCRICSGVGAITGVVFASGIEISLGPNTLPGRGLLCDNGGAVGAVFAAASMAPGVAKGVAGCAATGIGSR